MALQDEFEARFAAGYRKRISNPETRQPTSQNDTLVAQACTDAAEEFEQLVGVEFDVSLTAHAQLAALLVELWLLRYGAAPAAVLDKKGTEIRERAERLAKSKGGRRRVTPTSSSSYRHSTPSQTPRPEFDEEQFEDFTPRAPGRDEV